MKKLIITYCFVFFWLFAFGQSEKMRFEVMNNEVANNSVGIMAEDFQGNLWGFFNSTLVRFDGTNWTKYQHDPEDPCSITPLITRQIGGIYPGAHKDLWIPTSIGLIRLDLTKDCFTTFFSHRDSLQIVDIREDSNGNLWLLEAKKGLIKIKVRELLEETTKPDSIKYQVFPYQFLKKPGPGLMESIQILPDTKRGGLWLASLYGLGYFDPGKEKFSIYQPAPDTSSIPNPSNVIYHIFKDSRGVLWLGTPSGLIRFDPGSKKFDFFYPYGKDPKDTRDNWVGIINEIDDGRLILSTGTDYRQKLNLFDPVNHQFIAIDGNHRIDKNSGGQGEYLRMFKDRFGNLWIINTFFQVKLNSDDNRFVFYDINNRPNSIKGNFLQGLCADRQGNLYIGSDTHLNYLDRATGEVSYFSPYTSRPLPGVFEIIEDQSGMVWVGTSRDGLNRFDPKTKTFKQYLIPGKNATWISALYEDSRGILWVGTQGPGQLFQFDRKQEKFILISEDRQLWRNGQRSFVETESGDLWISSHGGLVFFDRQRNTFTKAPLKIPEQYLNGIHGILLDKNKKLWLCAITGPIFKYDPVSQMTYSYDHIPAFQDNKVRSIALDRHGMLWITSARGMIHFDPDSGKLIRLYASDIWLQPGQLWEAATMKLVRSKKGEIVVQGYSGVLVFHPDSVRINTVPPNVVIAGLRFQEEETMRKVRRILPRVISEVKAIRLPYYANDFSIDYVGIHLKDPKSNQYAYRLAPLEKDWQQVGTLRQAKYTNLAPGKYTFYVKASNSDGVWNEEGATLQITILPPWYWAWWSKSLYLLLILGLLYTFYRFQLNRRLATAEARRLQQLDEVKTRLYTNITHEFRTPLTVIQGATEQIAAESGFKKERMIHHNAQIIKRNGAQLLHLINQMLDLRKLEAGALPVRMVQSDILIYLKYLLESFQNLAENKDICLHLDFADEELIMDYDPEKIQHIVFNLLSNAIKFTPEGGEVFFSAGIQLAEPGEGSVLEIQVRDTGIGIPADKLPHVFDRFYQVDDASTRKAEGTGIGLTLAKELVRLLEGTIGVESRPGAGTTFLVRLPIRHVAPLAEKTPVFERRISTGSPLENLERTDTAPGVAPHSLALIVEDHKDVANYIRSCLASTYQIELAGNGREGIDKAIELVPDIIISDVMMPEIDGFEVTETLKNDARTSHIPIVLLTAKADAESRIAGLRRGADAYLAKPFDKEELLVRLEQLIALRKRLLERYQNAAAVVERVKEKNFSDPPFELEDAFLQQVRDLIEENLANPEFGNEDLCRALALSRTQLFRKLKALTGASSVVFIRSYRLNKARRLLLHTDLNISEVAYETGFNDPSYFGRLFKREFGIAPIASREKTRK